MCTPTIVCLCGSTRFGDAFQDANLRETLSGKIVLSIGCNMPDDDIFKDLSDAERVRIKAELDELHLRKIDIADEILVLNVDGYIGESTRRELNYAIAHGKRIRFLETSTDERILDLIHRLQNSRDYAEEKEAARLTALIERLLNIVEPRNERQGARGGTG